MNSYLTDRQTEIIRSLIVKSDIENRHIFDQILNGTLSYKNIDNACTLINDEYLINGIEENYEPNEYGRELEYLLDKINKPRTI